MTVIEANPFPVTNTGVRQPITPLTVQIADTHDFVGQQVDNAVETAFHHDADNLDGRRRLFSFKRSPRRAVVATVGEFSRQKVRNDLREEMKAQQAVSADMHLTRSAAGYKMTGVGPNGNLADTMRRKLREMETLDEVREKKVFSAIDDETLAADISEEIVKPLLRQTEYSEEVYASYQTALVELLNRPDHKKTVKKLRRRTGTVGGVMIDLPGLVEQARAQGLTGEDVDTASFNFEFARETAWSVHDGPKSKVHKATSVFDRTLGEKRAGEMTAVAAVAGHRLAGRETAAVVGVIASPAGMVAAAAVGGALRAGVAAGRTRKVSEIEQGYVKTAEDGRVIEEFKGYTKRRVAAEHLLHGGTYYLDSEFGPPIPISKQSVQTMLAEPQLYIGDLAARADEIISRIEVGDREDMNFIAYRKGHEVEERAELVEALAQINRTLKNVGYAPRRLNEYRDMVLHSHVTAENEEFKKKRRKQVAVGAGVGAAAAVGLRAAASGLRIMAAETIDATGFNEPVGASQTIDETEDDIQEGITGDDQDEEYFVENGRLFHDENTDDSLPGTDLGSITRTGEDDYIFRGMPSAEMRARVTDAPFDPDDKDHIFRTDPEPHAVLPPKTEQVNGVTVTMPANTAWEPDGQHFDLYKTDGGERTLLMDNATISEDGVVAGTRSQAGNEMAISAAMREIATPTAQFEPSGKPVGESWLAMSSPINEKVWFHNMTVGSDGTERGMTTTRVGNRGIRIDLPTGTAERSSEFLDLAGLIQANDPNYGLYLSRPDGTGIFISAPQGVVFNPDDITQTYQVDIAGTMKTVTSAELAKLVTPTIQNEADFLAIPDGTSVTTEGTEWQRIFAVDGGHLEAVHRVHNPDGTWTYKVTATIHGTGPAQALAVDDTTAHITVTAAPVDPAPEYRFDEDVLGDLNAQDREGGGEIINVEESGVSNRDHDSDWPGRAAAAAVGAAVGGTLVGAVLWNRRRDREVLPIVAAPPPGHTEITQDDAERQATQIVDQLEVIHPDRRNHAHTQAVEYINTPEVSQAEQSPIMFDFRDSREILALSVLGQYGFHTGRTPEDNEHNFRQEASRMKLVDRDGVLSAAIQTRLRALGTPYTDKKSYSDIARRIVYLMAASPQKDQWRRYYSRLIDPAIDPNERDAIIDVILTAFSKFDYPMYRVPVSGART